MSQNREQWGSKIGFILAASGSAVGIGNIWKYPSMAGENGGGAFTIVYLACILIVGLSIVVYAIIHTPLGFLCKYYNILMVRNIQSFHSHLHHCVMWQPNPYDVR